MQALSEEDVVAQHTLVKRRWLIAILLFFAGLINYFDRTIVSVALPVIAADLHMGPAKMGVLLSAFFWSYALMQVPRVLLGIGESIYLPGGMKLVSVLFPAKDRGLASGLVNCGTRAGLAFGAPLIAALVVAFGWKKSFFVLGFSSLVWLIPWLLTFPAGATTANRASAKGNWRLSTVDRNLWGMSLAHIGYGYYFYLMVTWLPTYLVRSRHVSLQAAGAYAVVPYLTFTLGETSLLLIPAGLMANNVTA